MANKDEYKVIVDSETEFVINWRELPIDVYLDQGKQQYLRKGNRNYHVEFIKFDDWSKTATVKVNGNLHKINIKDHLDLLIEDMGLETSPSKNLTELIAPMPGQVKEVHVQPGDHVEEGSPLLVLVAMKMENLLKASSSGKVKEVFVKSEDVVNKSDVLIKFG